MLLKILKAVISTLHFRLALMILAAILLHPGSPSVTFFSKLTYQKASAAFRMIKVEDSLKTYGTSGYNSYPLSGYGFATSKQYAMSLWIKKSTTWAANFESYMRLTNSVG